ncbi:hypothetical protein C0Z16_16820 [Paraburkholderia rhynchosiae]|uniref:C2H2-type domain-containing protein n=1 Tax=Paraburkholderia rhynchosiae TaxID=487049 RepID=A0ABX4V3B2_9BURK|nr:hypothetical protein C0Z16_16820 [Paraburkholderia rhynchosiae]
MSCAARYSETTSLEFILNPFKFFFTNYVAKIAPCRPPDIHHLESPFRRPTILRVERSRGLHSLLTSTRCLHMHTAYLQARTSHRFALRPRFFFAFPSLFSLLRFPFFTFPLNASTCVWSTCRDVCYMSIDHTRTHGPPTYPHAVRPCTWGFVPHRFAPIHLSPDAWLPQLSQLS